MTPAGVILGYHGCKASLAQKVVLRETTLNPSANGHDWLGEGVYFWAHDPVRALEWAEDQRKKSKQAAVVGAVMDLGRCLNLAERHAVEQVNEAWQWLRQLLSKRAESLTCPSIVEAGGPWTIGFWRRCITSEMSVVLSPTTL